MADTKRATPQTERADTDRLAFSVEAKAQTYGDGKTFYEYRIVMRTDGKPVGVKDGPRRTHATRAECVAAGRQRVRVLKTQRLFIVDVSDKDIDDGEARSCQACAIAQAMWRNQDRIGLPRDGFNFDVEPYGAFVDCDGIVLKNRDDWNAPRLVTGTSGMPDLVSEHNGRLWVESMYEWTMQWDEWADSRHLSDEEWSEEHPDDDCKPYRPGPCSFVLNLTEMKPASA